MKVFGIGLNKTGTTTLRDCLEILGYEVKGFDRQLTYDTIAGRTSPLFEVCEKYDAFQDFPWPLVYRQLDNRYPGSKFVLTTRADSNTWFESIKRHAYRTGPRQHRALIYGSRIPHSNKKEHIAFYDQHNAVARLYFQNRPQDFLELCWEKGDGWEKLCKFLEKEFPNQVLPHANRRDENHKSFCHQARINVRIVRSMRNDIGRRLKRRALR